MGPKMEHSTRCLRRPENQSLIVIDLLGCDSTDATANIAKQSPIATVVIGQRSHRSIRCIGTFRQLNRQDDVVIFVRNTNDN